MLEKLYSPPDENEKSWGLSVPFCRDWNHAKRRMMIIMQSVDGRDLKAKAVLGDTGVRRAMVNAIKYGTAHARTYESNLPSFAYAVVNAQSYRHLHLRGHAKAEAEAEFRVRLQKLIKKFDPTHILFSGDLNLLYPVENAGEKNGWVHTFDNRKVVSTLDFARLLEKDGQLANLLGFWCRHLAYLQIGYLPNNLANITAKPVLVDSIARLDKIVAKWEKAKVIAVDTETKNLTVLRNELYTIQFCFDHEPEKGYVIPVDHPHKDNPFTLEERVQVKKVLRKLLGSKKDIKELVTVNGMFDLRVLRKQLKMDIIWHKVWEITAGEHDLDENISSLSSVGIPMGGLAAMLCSYGNDFYFNATFGKDDRTNIAQTSPLDEGFLKYGAMDVVGPLHMRAAQIDRSKHQDLNGKPYHPYFMRHMLYQMSDTAHQLSHLNADGSLIDRKYLRSLLGADSPLSKAIDELQDEFKTIPAVQRANKELLDASGFKSGSLFGGTTSQWMFSFTKPSHKAKLFFEVLGLKAISKTATGADAVDKEFIEHYKDRNYIVALFGDFQGATKLLSTYVKGWQKKLSKEIDGAIDNHLRAAYKFFNVDTGRLASADPNLQNIPARGKLSKIIKEMFITSDGHLLIRYDYSAHEVRGWSIVSGDEPLAEAFRVGQRLRQQWIKTPTDEVKQELKKKGDIHIQNVFRVFKKWVEKSDPLRDAIKGVIFGLLYGKSAKTLGHDTKKVELDTLKAKIAEAYKSKSPDLHKLEKEFDALMDDDRTDYAQTIIDKMFAEFQRGHQWVVKMQKLATEKFYVYSPIGRKRHLYAAMTEDRKIVSRQVRRGMNAPIQGFASEIAVKAGRLANAEYYGNALPFCKKVLGLEGKLSFENCRVVHDATYSMVPFEMVIPFIHLTQYTATYGVAKRYEEEFGLKFTVEPEIELEIGVKDTKSYKWGWSLDELCQLIVQSVDDGIEAGFYKERSRKEIIDTIFAPWKNKKTLRYLQETYPLLGVTDLEAEITASVRKTYAAIK